MPNSRRNGDSTLADLFLAKARDSQIATSLYLSSGFQLKGEVVDFDRETILFHHKNSHQLVMRRAVATIFPVPDGKRDGDGWWQSLSSADSKNPALEPQAGP